MDNIGHQLLCSIVLNRSNWRDSSIPRKTALLNTARGCLEEGISFTLRLYIKLWLANFLRTNTSVPAWLRSIAMNYNPNLVDAINEYYFSRLWTTRFANFIFRTFTFGQFGSTKHVRPATPHPSPFNKYFIPGLAELIADQIFWPFVYLRDGKEAFKAHVSTTCLSSFHFVMSLGVRTFGSAFGRLIGSPGTAYWGEMLSNIVFNVLLVRIYLARRVIKTKESNFEGDLYNVLGVPRDATTAQIQKSYREKSLMYHPDRNAHCSPKEQTEAQEKFKAVNEAHTILMDPRQRQMYDVGVLRTSVSKEGPQSAVGSNGPPTKLRIAAATSAVVGFVFIGLPLLLHSNFVVWHKGAIHPGTLLIRLLQSSSG